MGKAFFLAMAFFLVTAGQPTEPQKPVREERKDRIVQVRGMLKKIRRTARQIEAQEKVLMEAAVIQAKLGEAVDCRKTVNAFGADPDTVSMLLRIAELQTGRGNLAGLRDNLRCAQEVAKGISEDNSRSIALHDVAVFEARNRDFRGALQTAASIGSEYWKGRAYQGIATAQASSGDSERATEFFERAIQAAVRLDEAKFVLDTLADIAEARAKSGDRTGALATFKQSEHNLDRVTRTFDKVEALLAIAVAEAHAGFQEDSDRLFSEAHRLTASIENDSVRADASGRMAQAEASAGNISAASESLRMTQDGFYRNVALGAIAEAQIRAGAFDDALRTIALLDDDSGRAYALRDLAISQIQLGSTEAAHETTMRIPRSWVQAEAMRLVCAAHARTSRAGAGEALRWADAIHDPHVRAFALLGVVEGTLERIEAGKAEN